MGKSNIHWKMGAEGFVHIAPGDSKKIGRSQCNDPEVQEVRN